MTKKAHIKEFIKVMEFVIKKLLSVAELVAITFTTKYL
jgi:hypothetical protein